MTAASDAVTVTVTAPDGTVGIYRLHPDTVTVETNRHLDPDDDRSDMSAPVKLRIIGDLAGYRVTRPTKDWP